MNARKAITKQDISAQMFSAGMDESSYRFFHSFTAHTRSTLLCHLTFRDDVKRKGANFAFLQFIDRIEHRYQDNVGWIRSTEHRGFPKGNLEEGIHVHALLLSHAVVEAEDVEELWTHSYGNAQCRNYDESKGGIGYILKHAYEEPSDWDISANLALFKRKNYFVGLGGQTDSLNAARRRVLRRQWQRMQKPEESLAGMSS